LAYATISSLEFSFDSARLWAALDSLMPGESSDFALSLAWWTGIAAIAISLVMLLAIILLRARLWRRRKHERAVIERWRPVLSQCVDGVPRNPPTLRTTEREVFLRLWNHFFESLRGAAGLHLVELARKLDMDTYAGRLLERGNLRERLLATLTLGHLRDGTRFDGLRALTSDPSPLLSLAAARACVEIDADEALIWLMPVIAAREDWPLARVSTVLAEAGANRITRPLADAFERVATAPDPGPRVARLQRLMEVAHAERMMPVVRRVLRSATNEQVIVSCLNALVEPGDVEVVRAHCVHPAWPVRMAAARALGRLGTPDDRKQLVDMLEDRHWWVRYRAARALIAMPFVNVEELKKVRETLEDRFAADMLGQVIAENE
jgi:hypothetical protein